MSYVVSDTSDGCDNVTLNETPEFNNVHNVNIYDNSMINKLIDKTTYTNSNIQKTTPIHERDDIADMLNLNDINNNKCSNNHYCNDYSIYNKSLSKLDNIIDIVNNIESIVDSNAKNIDIIKLLLNKSISSQLRILHITEEEFKSIDYQNLCVLIWSRLKSNLMDSDQYLSMITTCIVDVINAKRLLMQKCY